jgi:hypothetical protein
MNFKRWLDLFLDEKALDREHIFSVNGPSGMNQIPLGCLVDVILTAPENEKAMIKDTLVRIDFRNGNVLDYFKFLCGKIAK